MAEVFSISDVADKDELIYQAHSAPRHTLLHHIQRRSFTLMTSPPFWARDTVSSPYVAPVLEHFAGWALCIDEAAYNERWPEYLAGNVQFYPSESDDDADASASRVGRPPMTAARAAFAEMNYEKGELSWEQIGRQIEQKTGQKPSAKALRTWRADAEGESDT